MDGILLGLLLQLIFGTCLLLSSAHTGAGGASLSDGDATGLCCFLMFLNPSL
jgi:hypothetical protein